MMILTNPDVIGIQTQSARILPIFTNADNAIEFVGGLEHNGKKIRIVHIKDTDGLETLHEYITDMDISTILLDQLSP